MSEPLPLYTGVCVLPSTKENIDKLYKDGALDLSYFAPYKLEEKQNQYVVVNNKVYNERREEVPAPPGTSTASVITRVKGNQLVRVKVDKNTQVSGVYPRNKEQAMAFDALLDPSVEVVSMTGTAGTGKTLLCLAAALHLVESGVYEKIIISRQMTQVGNVELGILPGEVTDKFGPYLMNYMGAFSHLLGKNRKDGKVPVEDLIEQYHVEFIPFQLIRGCSWPNSLVIVDEIQNADRHEILTLGTRIGEKSKLVLMGDLAQRDTGIAKKNAGLFQWINSEDAQKSELVSSIHLLKCERSAICRLFAKVFEEVE